MCIKCGCGKKKGEAGYGMGNEGAMKASIAKKVGYESPKTRVAAAAKPKPKATPKPKPKPKKKTYKDATDRPGFLFGGGTI